MKTPLCLLSLQVLERTPFTVDQGPQHGTLTGRAPTLIYTPAPNYVGEDAFTFKVVGKSLTSTVATVGIRVNAVNDAPVAATSLTTQQVQYSDAINTVTITATDLDSSTLTASAMGLPGGLIFAPVIGKANSWTISGKVLDKPGVYPIKVTVSDGLLASPIDITIEVKPEDALAEYTGGQAVATSSTTSGTALLTLSATVREITAVTTRPLTDAHTGDIRKAKVRFLVDNTPVINTHTGNGALTDTQGWTSVLLVNAADIKTGTVLVKLPLNIGTADAQQYTLRVEVAGYYTAQEVTQVLNVYKPLNDFVTGGGYFVPTKSNGSYASDAGRKTNFGFNVKYTKSGKSLQGNINTIFRRKEKDGLVHVYQIKGNSMTSLSVDANLATGKTAVFTGKANLQDITNPDAPVSLGGNLTLQVGMTDKGEPGKNDLLGITVFSSSGAILYSSNWDGVKTAQMLLNGGNIIINSGSLMASATSPTVASRKAFGQTQEWASSQPTLSAYPNPATNKATIEFSLTQDEEYSLAIYDLKGTLVNQLPGGKAKAGNLNRVEWQAYTLSA